MSAAKAARVLREKHIGGRIRAFFKDLIGDASGIAVDRLDLHAGRADQLTRHLPDRSPDERYRAYVQVLSRERAEAMMTGGGISAIDSLGTAFASASSSTIGIITEVAPASRIRLR